MLGAVEVDWSLPPGFAIRAMHQTLEKGTVQSARAGIGSDSTDPDYVIRREAQLLLGRRAHALLLYAGSGAPAAGIAAADAETAPTVLPLIRDSDGDFARMYSASGLSAFVVRPDGYLGLIASDVVDAADLAPRLLAHLRTTFG
jgi:hypothetical protein